MRLDAVDQGVALVDAKLAQNRSKAA